MRALDTPAFRDAAMAVFQRLDPLADIPALPREDRTFSVAIPSTRTLAVGTVNAITPLTAEAFRSRARAFDINIRGREIQNNLTEGNPFALPGAPAAAQRRPPERGDKEDTGGD